MDSIDMGDLSTWKLQDCKDTSRRLLGFDPHNRTLDDLIRAIHTFFHLSTNTKISWHLSGEDCDRPTYGFNRHDFLPNPVTPWERRPLSLLNERQWPPQHVGRQIVMLHFQPPPTRLTLQPRSIRQAISLGKRNSVGDLARSMLSPTLSSLHLQSTEPDSTQSLQDIASSLPPPPLSAVRSTCSSNDERLGRDLGTEREDHEQHVDTSMPKLSGLVLHEPSDMNHELVIDDPDPDI